MAISFGQNLFFSMRLLATDLAMAVSSVNSKPYEEAGRDPFSLWIARAVKKKSVLSQHSSLFNTIVNIST